jgi:hypothetical protein
MAKTAKEEVTPVENVKGNKNRYHFLLRSVVRTSMTVPQSGAVTSAELDAVVSKWINDGWTLFATEVVGYDEQVFTVAVTLVRE